jgi:hypothetical protein
MLDVSEIEMAIENCDAEKLASLIKTYNLKIEDSRITADSEVYKKYENFWDQRQLIKKILLNS